MVLFFLKKKQKNSLLFLKLIVCSRIHCPVNSFLEKERVDNSANVQVAVCKTGKKLIWLGVKRKETVQVSV